MEIRNKVCQGCPDRFEGCAKLADDQSLPELYPEVFAEGLWLPSVEELQRYKKAMDWLAHEAGWRKVEVKDEH